MTLRETLTIAERNARHYRRGTMAWEVLMHLLTDLGFYGLDKREGFVVAWLNGVRFEI